MNEEDAVAKAREWVALSASAAALREEWKAKQAALELADKAVAAAEKELGKLVSRADPEMNLVVDGKLIEVRRSDYETIYVCERTVLGLNSVPPSL